jgi:hypothetical protein
MPKFVQKKTVSIMVWAIPQAKAPGANQLLCILFWRFAEKLAGNARLIDRGPENRQHGNKPHFTRVSLPFSAGNTEATGGNMLLLFLSRHNEATADRHPPPQKLYKRSHLIKERQKHGGQKHKIAAKSNTHRFPVSRLRLGLGLRLRSPRNTRLICRSRKSATRQQVLIVNDLSGNKIGNRPATCPLR